MENKTTIIFTLTLINILSIFIITLLINLRLKFNSLAGDFKYHKSEVTELTNNFKQLTNDFKLHSFEFKQLAKDFRKYISKHR